MFANGGKRIKPTLIDRIQDRYGHTIFKHDQRECRGCEADKWANQPEPALVDKREQVLDPMTAYQITSMMEGVVQRGTAHGRCARSASRSPARPAPPTTRRTPGSSASRPTSRSASISATTSRATIGTRRDRRRTRGADRQRVHEGGAGRQAGGAVPRAARHQADPHRSEDRHAHRGRATAGGLLEAFKPGTAPPDSYSVIGYEGEGRSTYSVSPDADRVVPTARGLY